MSAVAAILDRLRVASEGLPGEDESPDVVLEAVERMMDLRRDAFATLVTELQSEPELDPADQALAHQLQALDQAWAARIRDAMSTIEQRLEGTRRLKQAIGNGHEAYRPKLRT